MSIFKQPDIRSNTKTGGMMRKINLTLTGVLAVLAFVFTLGAGPIHAQVRTVATPACPIKATTVPPTKTPFTLPNGNLLGDEIFSVTGTVQVADQSGSIFLKTTYGAGVDSTRVVWDRTLNTLAHATVELTFDKGCTATDQYGSKACTWDWGQNVTAAYQGALQEAVTSGKFVVDLTVIQSAPGLPDNTSKVSFACPVCGGTCTIPVLPKHPIIIIPTPDQNNTPGQGEIWDLMTFPLFLTTPLPIFQLLIGGFANSQSHAQ